MNTKKKKEIKEKFDKKFFTIPLGELKAIQKHLNKKKITVRDYLDVVFGGL
jgi:hypothetical protein